ncbi:hypothetical protein HPB48_013081 [Haemaphysalis longicornis]|uniref:RRM domain-containing protein n=1 Tax=Haemaphysalis longicornis TaxID=44386 RepID=A0A9J6G5D7_HAELO|nr:hypothetical protein HPB48_013081 [Haemaphysalis longicornis]
MSRSAEDAILDDDIQSKDDYELDLDDANALLDLDDDETTSIGGNEANIEYVDEEGNPVTVCDGDNLEVVDEFSYNERATDDGDVLDVDVDPDFDSLLQEGEDAESGTSSQVRSQRHHTPQQPQRAVQTSTPVVHGMPEEPIPLSGGVEPVPSPSWSQSESAEKELKPLEDEEEDEEEGGRQGRFHAERRAGTVAATASAKRRQGIPDTLDQVISEADVARIDAFLSDDRRHSGRRGRGRGGGNFRGQNAKRGGGGSVRGGGPPRGGYRGNPPQQQQHQHIEPWVAPPFPLHAGPGLVQFGSPQQQQQQRSFHHPGAMAGGGGDGPRGKIFVNPQFRNWTQWPGRASGPGGRPPPGPAALPAAAAAAGSPRAASPLWVPAARALPAAPVHPAGRAAHAPRALHERSHAASRAAAAPTAPGAPPKPPATPRLRTRTPMRQQQQQLHHPPQHPQQQQLQHPHQQQNLHGQFGVPFPAAVAVQHQQQVLQQQHQQQQHQLQQHHHQQQQQQFHQQQRQQRPGSPMRGVHPYPPSPAFQGGPVTREPGSPMGRHPAGPAHLVRMRRSGLFLSAYFCASFCGSLGLQGVLFEYAEADLSCATSEHCRAEELPRRSRIGALRRQARALLAHPVSKRHPEIRMARGQAPLVRKVPKPRKGNMGPPARTVNNANIKEVPIVDYLPPPEPQRETLPPEIEEDVATQELRRKIEEQKKLRDQVMRIKEERRKLAVMQRQRDLLERRLQGTATGSSGGSSSAEPQPGSSSAPEGAPSAPAAPASVKQRLGVRSSPVAAPAPLPAEGSSALKKVVIVRRAGQQQQQQAGVSAAVPGPSAGTLANSEVHAGASRGVASLQGRAGPGVASRIGPVRAAGLATTGTPGAPRKAPGGHMMRPPARLPAHPGAIGRVLVSNLSVSTTEHSLRLLGRTCGVVTEIILDRNQRQAVVKFSEHQQAVQFQQRYQR